MSLLIRSFIPVVILFDRSKQNKTEDKKMARKDLFDLEKCQCLMLYKGKEKSKAKLKMTETIQGNKKSYFQSPRILVTFMFPIVPTFIPVS